MSRWIIIVVLLFIKAPAWGSSGSQRVLGYYPSWSELKPSQIGFEQFTHLAHAFLVSDKDGNLKTSKSLPSRELCQLAHAKGVKVVLSLGGSESGPTFSAIMAKPQAIERYVSKTVELVKAYGYDGVDIDWEHPQNEKDRADLVLLTRRFRSALGSGALITMAVGGTDWSGKWMDGKGLLPLVDFMNVMTYDMHGPWSDHAGYNAPLYPVTGDAKDGKGNHLGSFMDYWTSVKGWPKEKLNVGIPCYGYGYAVSSWGQKPRGKSAHSEGIAYKDIPPLIAQGWKRIWDPVARVPTLQKEGVFELISYEDEESASLKGAWARESGYQGVFFWEITQDLANGHNALVMAARKTFLTQGSLNR